MPVWKVSAFPFPLEIALDCIALSFTIGSSWILRFDSKQASNSRLFELKAAHF